MSERNQNSHCCDIMTYILHVTLCVVLPLFIVLLLGTGIEEDNNDDYSGDYEVIRLACKGKLTKETMILMMMMMILVHLMHFMLFFHHSATSLRFRRGGTIFSGSTITIQIVHNKRLHVGCYGGNCGGATCPGLYFSPWDYGRCRGEVFQVYRAAGPGAVRVGDDVGFYYPERRQWISAVRSQTNLAPCPGVPRNSRHRLNTSCWGEVFKIYARGKRVGQPIGESDSVMIYYPRSRGFLQYPHSNGLRDGLVRSTCPGRYKPPSLRAYDRCFQYVFEIHQRY